MRADASNGVVYVQEGPHQPGAKGWQSLVDTHHSFGTHSAPWHLMEARHSMEHVPSIAAYLSTMPEAATAPASSCSRCAGAMEQQPLECRRRAGQRWRAQLLARPLTHCAEHCQGTREAPYPEGSRGRHPLRRRAAAQALKASGCVVDSLDKAQAVLVDDYCYYVSWLGMAHHLGPQAFQQVKETPGDWMLKARPPARQTLARWALLGWQGSVWLGAAGAVIASGADWGCAEPPQGAASEDERCSAGAGAAWSWGRPWCCQCLCGLGLSWPRAMARRRTRRS